MVASRSWRRRSPTLRVHADVPPPARRSCSLQAQCPGKRWRAQAALCGVSGRLARVVVQSERAPDPDQVVAEAVDDVDVVGPTAPDASVDRLPDGAGERGRLADAEGLVAVGIVGGEQQEPDRGVPRVGAALRDAIDRGGDGRRRWDDAFVDGGPAGWGAARAAPSWRGTSRTPRPPATRPARRVRRRRATHRRRAVQRQSRTSATVRGRASRAGPRRRSPPRARTAPRRPRSRCRARRCGRRRGGAGCGALRASKRRRAEGRRPRRRRRRAPSGWRGRR